MLLVDVVIINTIVVFIVLRGAVMFSSMVEQIDCFCWMNDVPPAAAYTYKCALLLWICEQKRGGGVAGERATKYVLFFDAQFYDVRTGWRLWTITVKKAIFKSKKIKNDIKLKNEH